MKNKPFLLASLIFGGIAILLLIVSSAIFLSNDTSFCVNLTRFLGMKANSITNSTIGELGVVFSVPSFIFAFKSLSDNEVASE